MYTAPPSCYPDILAASTLFDFLDMPKVSQSDRPRACASCAQAKTRCAWPDASANGDQICQRFSLPPFHGTHIPDPSTNMILDVPNTVSRVP